MNVTRYTVYSGPSIYCDERVVHFVLGDCEPVAGLGTQRVLDALGGRLPGLREEVGNCGAKAPGAASDDAECRHLFEHVCIALQNVAGAELSCVNTTASRRAPDEALVPYEEASVCLAAARLASDFLDSLSPAQSSDGAAFDFEARLHRFIRDAQRRMLPIQDRALVKAARARDVSVLRVAGRVVQLGQGSHQRRLSATKTTFTNVVSNDIAANKDYSRRVLADIGLPTPRYVRVSAARAAVDAANRIGYPVVVKPNKGNMGHGVSVGMRSPREVRAAFRRAREHGRSVLVEEQVEGLDYRMVVIDGNLVAAARRVPGHVRGDGVHTIDELLAITNADPRRGSGQRISWTRIELDEQAERLLAELGYTRNSVPADGESVYLRRNANTSDGGTAVDVTDEVHPDNREIAVRAARAIGLDIAGVDLLTRDISRSIWEAGGCICEINSRPGLRKHMWPAEGKPRDVMTPIVDMLFPPAHASRVPVVAVTGTGATNVTARMLAHIFTGAGRGVGLVAGHRVFIDGRSTSSAQLALPKAIRSVLLDPDVDMVIIELTVDDLLDHGLAFDAVDVCVLTGVSPGQGVPTAAGSQHDIVDALRVVTRNTRDAVIVGDDELGRALDGSAAETVRLARDEQSVAPAGIPPGDHSRDTLQGAAFASLVARRLGASREHVEERLASFRVPDGERLSAIPPLPAKRGVEAQPTVRGI